MKCSFCNTTNPDGGTTCIQCGKALFFTPTTTQVEEKVTPIIMAELLAPDEDATDVALPALSLSSKRALSHSTSVEEDKTLLVATPQDESVLVVEQTPEIIQPEAELVISNADDPQVSEQILLESAQLPEDVTYIGTSAPEQPAIIPEPPTEFAYAESTSALQSAPNQDIPASPHYPDYSYSGSQCTDAVCTGLSGLCLPD